MPKPSKLRGLAVTVKLGERIQLDLGHEIAWVGASEVDGDRVKIVIDAPKTIKILREEILWKHAN